MKQIVHLLLITSLLLISGPGTGWAADPLPSDDPNGDASPQSIDQGFVRDAGQGLIFDVIAANLAFTHSFNPAVRKFARVESRDHSRDYGRLTSISNRLRIFIPTVPSNQEFEELQNLSLLYGRAFDRAYLRAAITRHSVDTNRYTNEARFGSDPGLRAFANTRIGVLFQHLQLAFATAQKSGVNLNQL